MNIWWNVTQDCIDFPTSHLLHESLPPLPHPCHTTKHVVHLYKSLKIRKK